MGSEGDELEESGSALRAKLEAALAEANQLRSQSASLLAEKVVRDEGLKYVKPEDLTGVDSSQLADKAREIEAARTAERNELLQSVLAENGLTLEGVGAKTSADDAASRVASLGKLGGVPPSQREAEVAPGPSRIHAAMRNVK